MPLSNSFVSGKNGRFLATHNAVQKTWGIKRWSITLPNQLQDITNTESGGFGEYLAGVTDLSFTVELDHFVGSAPFATFIPGDTLTEASLYVSVTEDVFWVVHEGLIEEVEETVDVRGLASIRLRCRGSQASIYINGNNMYSWPENEDK